MSKRAAEESMGGLVPNTDQNGLLPIHDLLSPDEDIQSGPSKKARNFIATVVSERVFLCL